MRTIKIALLCVLSTVGTALVTSMSVPAHAQYYVACRSTECVARYRQMQTIYCSNRAFLAPLMRWKTAAPI